MKLYLETDGGEKFPITEVKNITEGSSDVLFFMCNRPVSKDASWNIERILSDKTGRRCILIPPFISSIFGIDEPKMMD